MAELSNSAEPVFKKDPVSKSSTEILSELFGAFNAEPPTISDVIPDDSSKKKKKSKKKTKHKKKKKKKSQKKGRSSSDVSDNESDSENTRKRSKKSKHKRHKRHKSTQDSDASSVTSNKNCNLGENLEPSPKRKKHNDTGKTIVHVKTELEPENSAENLDLSDMTKMDEIPIPKMPDISQIKLPEENKKTQQSTEIGDKNKQPSNKIQIKNLKFSSVFEATVKQAEEEARKKAEKYEDGELTDTSCSSSNESLKIPSITDSENDKDKNSDFFGTSSKTDDKLMKSANEKNENM